MLAAGEEWGVVGSEARRASYHANGEAVSGQFARDSRKRWRCLQTPSAIADGGHAGLVDMKRAQRGPPGPRKGFQPKFSTLASSGSPPAASMAEVAASRKSANP